jgi:hypothetical protein
VRTSNLKHGGVHGNKINGLEETLVIAVQHENVIRGSQHVKWANKYTTKHIQPN